jgi:hypothetical protein
LRYDGGVKSKIVWPVALILVFALSRWPGVMPQNFSAAYALFFCAGLYLPRRLAWTVPLGIIAVMDVALTFGFYHPPNYSFLQFVRDMAPNYAAYAVLIGLGRALGRRRAWGTLLSGGIFGAILFYFITNTASWLFLAYPKTLAGWIQALTRGLPGYPPVWEFFRGTFLSGGIFSGLFVGAMKAVEDAETAPEKEAAEAEPEAEPEEGQPALAPAANNANDH